MEEGSSPPLFTDETQVRAAVAHRAAAPSHGLFRGGSGSAALAGAAVLEVAQGAFVATRQRPITAWDSATVMSNGNLGKNSQETTPGKGSLLEGSCTTFLST